MSAWIWIIIPLVAIVGGYIIDYQKNKLKWQAQTSSNEKETEELRLLMQQLKKRIENLEAIAASEPNEFRQADAAPLDRIEIDDENIKNENRKSVENMVKNKGE